MVVGHGMIGNGFSHYKFNDEVIIFASGVSNSKDNSILNFERENDLLVATCKQYRINC